MLVHKPEELITDPMIALEFLKDGNKRYLFGNLVPKTDYDMDRLITENEQHPFAIILCCSDSRVAPEIFFDQEIGDIFTIRNAGNVVDNVVLGSIEYAVEHLKSPLVVVCGHSHCGAVTACVEGELCNNNIKSIINLIEPAKKIGGDLEVVTKNHVRLMVEEILVYTRFDTAVVGAYYNLHSGEVNWL